MKSSISRVAEDYLQVIWKALECSSRGASTSEIASQLGVTPSTVSANLKKIAKEGLIQYRPYGPISLTEKGQLLAIPLVRRHRIIEAFLVAHLGLSWDQVHNEAQELEHAVSPLVLECMDRILGYPTHDPHGSPIPSNQGAVIQEEGVALDKMTPKSIVLFSRVSSRSSEVLRYLKDRGLVVGTEAVVEGINRGAGVLHLRVNGVSLEISLKVAKTVYVTSLQGLSADRVGIQE